MSNNQKNKLRIWCLLDGKPGHQNQTLGLVEALQRSFEGEIDVRELAVPVDYPKRLIGPWWSGEDSKSPPDMILGAGHATHLPMLIARRRFGGRSIVLMKPSLPMSLFDLCVIPDSHLIRRTPANVLLTRGVLNRIRPSSERSCERLLVLLGGPSKHFHWSDEMVRNQLADICADSGHHPITIATSRRTPENLITMLGQLGCGDHIVRHDEVPRDWLPAQLSSSSTVWVTEDSVSMTYEAVTSGANVGTIELDRKGNTRVTTSIDKLVETGSVIPFSKWQTSRTMNSTGFLVSEADRVALAIQSILLKPKNTVGPTRIRRPSFALRLIDDPIPGPTMTKPQRLDG